MGAIVVVEEYDVKEAESDQSEEGNEKGISEMALEPYLVHSFRLDRRHWSGDFRS